MSRGIVQKLTYLFHCVFSQVCLLRRDRPQCCKHSYVDALCIIKESANDLLDEFFFLDWGAVLTCLCLLHIVPLLHSWG
jgi:hypothetical protein